MKIYLTLNEEKEKDRVIINYLNAQYSKSGKIKDILYQEAVKSGKLPMSEIAPKEGENQQEAPKSSKKQLIANAPKSGKKLDIAEFL